MTMLRSFLLLLFLVGFVKLCELAPMRAPDLANDDDAPSSSSSSSSSSLSSLSSSSSSSSSSTSLLSSSVPMRKGSRGASSPSELTWEAWLLVDAQAGDHTGLDSANILRKITPKSIFFAPTRIECAEGYRADTMDRCVKDVKIDHEAQFDFLLKRVSAMYLQRFGGGGTQDQKTKDQKQSTGPLQLSIPFLGAPIASPMESSQQPMKNEEEETNEPQKETVTVYEVKNETTTSEEGDETRVFLDNTGGPFTDKNDPGNVGGSKSDRIVPVVEFVDETNGTSFSEVVDYKIPIDLKAILNVSNSKRNNGSEIVEKEEEEEVTEEDSMTKEINSTNMSPTLVFVLTPTKRPQAESSSLSSLSSSSPSSSSPSSSSLTLFKDDSLNGNATAHVIVRMTESVKNSTTSQEIIGIGVPDSLIPPLRKLSEIPLVIEDQTESNASVLEASGMKVDDGEVQEATYEDEDVVEDVDDEDEYVDNTDPPEEEFTEVEGEILKHGEAGITIPVKNLDRLHLDEHHREVENLDESNDSWKKENDKFDASRDEISIRFNHSTTSNVDEVESNISSEAAIKDDVIVETTLLNVNPVKATNVVKSPLTNDSNENDEEERLNIRFEPEKTSDGRSKVVFPTDEPLTVTSTDTENNRQVDDDDQIGQTRFKEKKNKPTDLRNVELIAEPSSSESLLYDPRPGDRYPDDPLSEIHTMEESSRTTNSPHSRTGSLQDLEGSLSYIRSPQSFVKFPSDEINSIHNQDYKDRGQDLYNDGPYASSTSTKSTVPVVHQKSSYSRTPSGWRIDRQQQPDRERHRTVVVQRQKPRPVYLEFRTKTPLMRVPSLFSISQPSRSATIVDRGYRNAYLQVSPLRRVGY